jgi:hypothetical protein
MNSIETTDGVSFEGYVRRYRLNPGNEQVKLAFTTYLLHKMDTIKAQKPDSNFTDVIRELRSPSLSFKRLKHLAYLVSLTPAERQQLQNMPGSFTLNQRNLPGPKLFARGFHQMAESALQWNLASELESNPTFQAHFQETLNAHSLNEPKKAIEQMEQDLAQISDSSLFKHYLRERKFLDREGRIIKAETPFETRQRIECYLQLLAHVLELEMDPIAAIDLKEWDEKISSIIYTRFSVAVDKNPKWKKNLAELQSSDKSAAEKIEEIKQRLSKENQVQKLLEALSLKVDSDHLESFLADPALSSLGLGFPQCPTGLFLEEWQTKQVLNALYLELHSTSALRSKVEELCRAIGIPISQRQTVYELYSSYVRAFKESCSELKNPLHVLLAKEAHLNRDAKVLEQMRPKLSAVDEHLKLSPTDSTRTSNESPASEGDVEFQTFILDKGLQSKRGTREYNELLKFTRDLYDNPVQCLSGIDVATWDPKAKEECLKWLSSSFFVECLNVDPELDDHSNPEAVLAIFERHAGEEIKRLRLPSIYVDMLASALSSGNMKRLKLIADEIAYARYCEANPHTELTLFKDKTISEKIESTKNYLKKMKDRSQAGYFLAYMESFPVLIGKVSSEVESYLDLYLAGSDRENAFYKYLESNGLNPLSIEKDKRIPYLFYLWKKFVKQKIQEALKPGLQKKGGAALACELKATHFLDLTNLDLLAELIGCGQEVDIDYCLSLGFYAAARKLFIDRLLSDPTFDVVEGFIKIKKLSEQKALLDALEKQGHGSVIHTIIMKGTLASYLAGYEWLRDRIKSIPEGDFMPFFLKHFTIDSEADGFLESANIRSNIKAAVSEFQAAIKAPQFLNSHVRALLEKERIIDGSGDLIWHVTLEEMFIKLDLCFFTQREFIKMNRERAQLDKRINLLKMDSNWMQILTELNADIQDALENGISLDLRAQEVEALIRTATAGAAGNSFFSDYLKEIKLEEIKGLSPRKHYELYVSWTNTLIHYFKRKFDPILGTELGNVGYQAHQALEEGIRNHNWSEVNKHAKTLLLVEGLTQKSPTDPASSDLYDRLGKEANLPSGFFQKSLQSKNGLALVREEENRLESTARLDRTKWIREITLETDSIIKWLNNSCFKSFMTDVNSLDLSIAEKKLKVDCLMHALAKVLTQEFERLKMSPSYKDLIERAFDDGNASLCDFLVYEAAYGNYQQEVEKLREQGGDVSTLDEAEELVENDPLQKKIAKIMVFLSDLPQYKSLLDAIDPDRLKELTRVEIASN